MEWTKEKLIQDYYSADCSGNPCQIEEYKSSVYFKRVNSKLITCNKKKEFILHFSILLPTFQIETFNKEYDFDFAEDDGAINLCICGNRIHHICKFISIKSKMIFQVGNCCIEKELKRLKLDEKYKCRKKEYNKKQEEKEAKMKQDEIDYIKKEIADIDAEHARLEQEKIDNINRIKELYHIKTHKPCVSCKLYLLEKQDWRTLCKSCYRKKVIFNNPKIYYI
jgi:hypothetical protein